jgi:hypothetical protein
MTVLFCWSATAQNGVTVSNLDVEPGTVTFNVSWRNTGMPTLWSDSVWVFVDYNDAGVMKRLPVTSATATAGTVTKIQGNDKGAWVVGNARTEGSFSATVQLHAATADLEGVCAYASNYPPIGEYTAANKIEFTGTPPYDIMLKHSNGTTDTLQSGKVFLVPASYTLLSFSDKTGAPGFQPSIQTPPYAATRQTWKFGSSTLTWSDRILTVPEGCSLTTGTTHSPCLREYRPITSEGYLIHHYTLYCLNYNKSVFCPTPWRVASSADYLSIVQLSTAELALQTWTHTGYGNNNGWSGVGSNSREWCSDSGAEEGVSARIESDGKVYIETGNWCSDAKIVRCVH